MTHDMQSVQLFRKNAFHKLRVPDCSRKKQGGKTNDIIEQRMRQEQFPSSFQFLGEKDLLQI